MKHTEKSFTQQRAMRTLNRFRVLEAIAGGMRTRRQIQHSANLSWGTVSSCVSELTAENILQLLEKLPGNFFAVDPPDNCRSTYCSFSRNKNLLAGITLTAESAELKISTPDRQLITCAVLEDLLLTDAASLQHIVRQLFERSGIAPAAIAGTVIALTGVFDRNRKIWLKTPHLPQVDNWDLAPLEKIIPGEVIFEHDIISKARSVTMKRPDFGNDFAFLHWGSGIGLTVCRNGIFQEGHRGFAGEIGHIPYPGINSNSSLENAASLHSAALYAAERHTSLDSREVWEFIKPHLLWCLTTVSGLFDPAVIALGGELPDIFHEYLPELSGELENLSWTPLHNQLKFYNMTECDTAAGASFAVRSTVLNHIAENTEDK